MGLGSRGGDDFGTAGCGPPGRACRLLGSRPPDTRTGQGGRRSQDDSVPPVAGGTFSAQALPPQDEVQVAPGPPWREEGCARLLRSQIKKTIYACQVNNSSFPHGGGCGGPSVGYIVYSTLIADVFCVPPAWAPQGIILRTPDRPNPPSPALWREHLAPRPRWPSFPGVLGRGWPWPFGVGWWSSGSLPRGGGGGKIERRLRKLFFIFAGEGGQGRDAGALRGNVGLFVMIQHESIN